MAEEIKKTVLTKEEIRTRMIRNAATLWGLKDADINSFDPVVNLLINASSHEIFNIYNEIENSQVRILERLAALLTPDMNAGPGPAHGILHARPNDIEFEIKDDYQVFVRKKIESRISGKVEDIEIFFSPVTATRLVDGKVKYIAAGSTIHEIAENGGKTPYAKFQPRVKLDPFSVWVGLELSSRVTSLDQISFFFDWRNVTKKQQLFNILHLSKWYLGEHELGTKPGILKLPNTQSVFADASKELDRSENNRGTETQSPAGEKLQEKFELVSQLENHVQLFYKKSFVTISKSLPEGEGLAPYKVNLPYDLSDKMPPPEISKFKDPLIWIKIQFHAAFGEDVLDDILVQMNCFPVVNRRLNSIRHRLQPNLNIVALPAQEQFFALRSVTGIDDEPYTQRLANSHDETRPGTFSQRYGGVERFDSRDATQMLDYLNELLKAESASFSAMGNEFVSNLIRTLNQDIAQLEQKIQRDGSKHGQKPTYLLIRPRTEGEIVTLQFWSTNGNTGNFVSQRDPVEIYSGSELQRDSMALMTVMTGGHDSLQPSEVLGAYKSALLSHGRLVTSEDIRSFCHAELGDRVHTVDIKKGIAVGEMPHEGLVRTIDVYLNPADGREFKQGEWETFSHDLKLKLEERSMEMYRYRIFVEDVVDFVN